MFSEASGYWKIQRAEVSRLLMCRYDKIPSNVWLFLLCIQYIYFFYHLYWATLPQLFDRLKLNKLIHCSVSYNISEEEPGCHALPIIFIFKQENSFEPSSVCISTVKSFSLTYSYAKSTNFLFHWLFLVWLFSTVHFKIETKDCNLDCDSP